MKKNDQRKSFVCQGFKKTREKLFSLMALFLFVGMASLHAQSQISGVVADSVSGDPLPGVNVLVKGTTTGVTTDLDGKYTIDAASNSTLVFSFIGYEQKEFRVSNQTVINVKLRFAAEELEEVLVVGYGTMKRTDITGAVVSVTEEDLKAEVVNSIDQAIQGKAAGVQVMQNSGSPSAATSIRIRGINSLRNNEPLYVIDGIPVGAAGNKTSGFNWHSGGNGQTIINPLSTLNPADIVSIEILKDASASAIYGSKGANGVVLVTTKKGKSGEAQVSYDFKFGMQTPAKLLEVLNLKEYAKYQNDIADLGYASQRDEFADLSLVPEEGTDWQREIFSNAPLMEHNLTVSGGNDKTKYSVSGGYKDQEGMIVGTFFERVTGRASISSEAKPWLNIGANILASRNKEAINLTDADDGVITRSLLLSPAQEIRNAEGEWAGPTVNNTSSGENPVAKAFELTNDVVRTRMLGNIYADIKILKNFVLRTEFGADLNYSNNYNFVPTSDWGRQNSIAESRRQFNNNTFWNIKNYLTYSQDVDVHAFKVMVGQEAQRASWEGLIGSRKNFPNNNIQELNAGGTDAGEQKSAGFAGHSTNASFFSRANYAYANKYLVTATMRADGSSKFGPNNRWGYFPSFAVAWKLDEEGFLKDIDWLYKLKLRSGWGQVGNDAIGNYTYGASMMVRPTSYGAGFLVNNLPNPDVKWETTNQWNIGVDVSVFKNRVELIAEYYIKNTKDMLISQPVPDYLGTLDGIGQDWQGIKPPFTNIGEMENKGLEFTLNTNNITSSNFSWNTSITFSNNKNKVTALGVETAAIFRKIQWWDFVTKTTVGQPVGQFYGYVTDGIFQSVDEINTSPSQGDKVEERDGVWPGDIKFKNIYEDDVIDDKDRTIIGDPNPDFTFGISNNLSYKNIDFSVYLNGSYGNEVVNFQRIRTEAMSEIYDNQLKTVVNRWTPENPTTTMPRLIPSDPNQNTRISSRYVEDGSFIRISNVTLGYRLPNELLSKTFINSARFYGKVQNLYTFTKYSGYDPEVGSYNQDALLSGIDNGRYPLPRTFLLGLNLTF